MDIHRTRFVPYPPSAINALAFSYPNRKTNLNGKTPDRDPTCLRLAIGRANGNIEIWNPARGAWIHETTFYGGKERSIEGLAWIQEPEELDDLGNIVPGQLRLFSIGYSNVVTEWDLLTGLPLRNSGGSHGDVWCLAAQPPWEPPKNKTTDKFKKTIESSWRGQNLVVGCADGTLAVISTADNDLQFKNYLARSTAKKARVLSVTYKDRDIVIAGYANGTVGVYDTSNGTQIRNISLGPGPRGGSKDVLVWAIRSLPWNGDIAVGDSNGEVRFYDGKNYSQIGRLAAHHADVLTLAVGSRTKLVFSGSMDRRVSAYMSGEKQARRWTKLIGSKFHEHDVKATAVYEGRDINVLVSGGLDIGPVVVPTAQFGQQYHLSLSITPQRPPMTSSPKRRLVTSWWAQEARIWHYPESEQDDNLPKLLARIGLDGEESITSASMDENGRYLALATAASTRIFQITNSNEQDISPRKLNGVELPGARFVKMSPDGRWLVMISHANRIELARLTSGSTDEKAVILPHLMTLKRRQPSEKAEQTLYDGLNGSWGQYRRTVVNAEFSANGRVLVVGDLAGHLDTFLLQGDEDLAAPDVETTTSSSADDESDSDDEMDDESSHLAIKGQSWVPCENRLPQLEAAPLILAFRPLVPHEQDDQQEINGNSNPASQENHILFVVDGQHHIYEFDVITGRLTKWSRSNPLHRFPLEFRSLKDRVMGHIWDITSDRKRIWLYGGSWLFMFNISGNMDDTMSMQWAGTNPTSMQAKLERRRNSRRDFFNNVAKWQKESEGAGDITRQEEIFGLGRTMRKITHDAEGKVVEEIISVADVKRKQNEEKRRKRKADVMDEDDSEMDQPHFTEDVMPLDRDQSDSEVEGTGDGVERRSQSERKWWGTYKYRPILGIVPLRRRKTAEDDLVDVPEVVLVERPLWDVDLPPRFMTAWEKERGEK